MLDGIIELEIAPILAQGAGRVHGIDSSSNMIEAAKKAVAVRQDAADKCTFEG